MKKFASVIIAVVTLILCFSLSACGDKYVSHYSAMLMVRENTSDKGSVSFDGFSGTYVIKLKNNGADEVFITYEATLREGNIKVYYDYNDEKLNLFDIETDGSVDGKTETFTGNKTIYIIIESDGTCNDGSFSFSLSACDNSIHDRIGDEWKTQIGATEEVMVKCYGEFDDVHVVLLICGDAAAVEGEETVDGVDFHYNYEAHSLTVWQNGKFYSLQEGFERGILTHENLVTVRENHKAEYGYMYEME